MYKKLIVMALTSLMLAACASETEQTDVAKEETSESTKDTVKTEEDQNEVEETGYRYPLSGVQSKDPSEMRSFAVMINNHPNARPQSGLTKADIVYELLAEGSVTRFLAIFQSESFEKVGPVRSARDYFIQLADGYDSIYIAHGYSPEARKMLNSGFIDHLNGMEYDGILFKRSSDRVAPHNSYISYENIMKGAENLSYDLKSPPDELTFLSKSDTEKIEGEAATSVKVSYYNKPSFTIVYEYDEALGKYTRTSGGVQTAEHETQEPVLLDNILIVETEHTIIDDAGRREIDLTSGGDAYLLQKGKLQKVQWVDDNGRILPYVNNQPVGLVKGKTWINVIPSDGGFSEFVTITE